MIVSRRGVIKAVPLAIAAAGTTSGVGAMLLGSPGYAATEAASESVISQLAAIASSPEGMLAKFAIEGLMAVSTAGFQRDTTARLARIETALADIRERIDHVTQLLKELPGTVAKIWDEKYLRVLETEVLGIEESAYSTLGAFPRNIPPLNKADLLAHAGRLSVIRRQIVEWGAFSYPTVARCFITEAAVLSALGAEQRTLFDMRRDATAKSLRAFYRGFSDQVEKNQNEGSEAEKEFDAHPERVFLSGAPKFEFPELCGTKYKRECPPKPPRPSESINTYVVIHKSIASGVSILSNETIMHSGSKVGENGENSRGWPRSPYVDPSWLASPQNRDERVARIVSRLQELRMIVLDRRNRASEYRRHAICTLAIATVVGEMAFPERRQRS